MSHKPPAGWTDYIAFLTLLTLACLYISRADAYDYNGEKWMSRIDWYMGTGCPKYVKESALSVYDEIEANVEAIETRYVTHWSQSPRQDERTTIYCGDTDVQDGNSIKLPWWLEMREGRLLSDDGTTVVGRARWYYKPSDNEIVECDVWLNSSELTESTVDKYVRHEIGHCLGLQHSEEAVAVMYFAAILPYYHVDDWAGLKRLYQDYRPVVDAYLNLYTGLLDTRLGVASGIIDSGYVWPDDAYSIEIRKNGDGQ